jgi:ubiquinone/menaquinone biosynthesis C-methylase UbiE
VYDEMGEAYEAHSAVSDYNAHYDRPAVLAALGPVEGLRVLDAACGPGFYLASLLSSGALASGFDASLAMVELARARVGSAAPVEVARLGEALPYRSDSFDAAICALAIHYVDDRLAAFAELHRVLRPGGLLVISTQHPTTDWLRKGGSYFAIQHETDDWKLASGATQQVTFWREPLQSLCDAAADAGFLIARVIEPRPAESMRELSPRNYEKLTTEPAFLLLKLLKPA